VGQVNNSQRAGPVHFGLKTLAPVTVEVTFMANGGPRVRRIPKVKPGDNAGKPLVVRAPN
jgi:hypothetical protein